MQLKQFQREDLARAALRDGCVISWDTGLGKSLAAFLLPFLKLGVEITDQYIIPKGTTLFVAPTDLFDQFVRDANSTASMFYQRVVHLDCQETFLRFSRVTPEGRRILPRGFYITSYTELTRNGVKDPPAEYAENTGTTNRKNVKCVYTPTLADLCANTFDAVVVDEGVRMKGDHTAMGIGLRQMNPRFRYVLTATPIKNRLSDIFQLLSWSAFATTGRTLTFPYGPRDKQEFIQDFMVSEENLTKKYEIAHTRGVIRKVKRVTSSITNTHKLWKLISPLVLRRRKDEAGIDIVPKHKHRMIVPMGLHQMEAYKYHIDSGIGAEINSVMVKLQSLRICAADPTSALLKSRSGTSSDGPWRSNIGLTPKMWSILSTICNVMERSEQVIVFSALTDALYTISGYLDQAGVSHFIMNGDINPKKRGRDSVVFGRGEVPVVLAGEESTAEGHNWAKCNNVIRCAYSWAFDKGHQCVNRAHRMTSTKPVNVYSILCQGSIDLKLEATGQEKAIASELALDGLLLEEPVAEINFWDLLQTAQNDFRTSGGSECVDESVLMKDLPILQKRLKAAALNWRLK